MKKWMKTAGLIFMAAASVYSGRAIAANPRTAAKPSNQAPATDVKLLEEADPFATGPTTAPAVEEVQATAPAAPMQMNDDGTFSLNITAGADIVEQLRVVGFQSQMSIIPSREVRGTLPAMDLYNVTVPEALDAMLHANGFAWREEGKFIKVYSLKEIQQIEQASRVTHTEIFRLSYITAADAMVMIKPVLSKEGGEVAITPAAKSGISSGASGMGGMDYSSNDVLVVTDYQENLDRVRAVLKELDRRPQQILIEATILRASLSEDNALGVDFNVVGGIDFSNITHSSGQILNANLPSGEGPAVPGGSTVHSVGTGNNFSSTIPNAFKVGVVTDNVSVFLAALEGVTDTTILANPKVLALNKQKGEVIVGREDGYLTTTTTETSSTQTIEFLKTGTRLVFRPYIAEDGYIRMEVHPEDSSGGLQTSENLPFKVTTEVSSNVMVKDGHTVVIGGLFRESSDSTKSQIPVLGNLPLAGVLFRNQRDSTRREEVIILLTPHIVKDDSAYSDLSKEAMKDAEKLRVGVRQGMMFWGRGRLAEINYEIAVEKMNKGDRGSAMWHVDAALNLNPKMLEALKLKQELTGKEVTMPDGSTIRGFVTRAILRDVAPATQPMTDAGPATQPSTDGMIAITFDVAPTTQPTTQPIAEADQPTTQPVAEADQTTTDDVVETAEIQTEVAVETPVEQTPAQGEEFAQEEYETADEYVEVETDFTPLDGENATQPAVTETPTEEIPGGYEFGPGEVNK